MGALEAAWAWISQALLGLGAGPGELTALQMSVRALVVFIVTILLVRLGNQRFMGRSTRSGWYVFCTRP